jgi:hypothetical protein
MSESAFGPKIDSAIDSAIDLSRHGGLRRPGQEAGLHVPGEFPQVRGHVGADVLQAAPELTEAAE